MMFNKSNKKPCCKVCQDAGKPEDVYTSHWVKDLSGKTVCPTLLNSECRFCHKLGHTTKYCKELEQMNKDKAKIEKKLKYQSMTKSLDVKQEQKHIKCTNMFAAFCDDNSCESDNVDSDHDVTSTKTHIDIVIPTTNTWASIAAKNKPIPKPTPTPAPKKIANWATKPVAKKSWADLSDSDEDDDDEEDDEDELPEVNFNFDTGYYDQTW